MYIRSKRLERELKFTEIFKNYETAHKSVREAMCLESQFVTYFVAPKHKDVIAGRVDSPRIVFSPCIEGDGMDKIAYGIDKGGCLHEINEMKKEGYDTAYITQCEEMIEFWETKNTNTVIRNKFPKEWGTSFGTDEYFDDNTVIHPLYRLAGANLDFKKLFSFGIKGLAEHVETLMNASTDANKKGFYEGAAKVLYGVRNVLVSYHAYAVEELKTCDVADVVRFTKMKDSLAHIIDHKPETLQQAVQLMTVYALCGRNVELGRIDNYLGDFYKNDLEQGNITHEEAVVLICNLFEIFECERGRDTRAIIGGLGRDNEESADMFAHLVMDVGEIRVDHFYPQISLRFYEGMNETLYNRALEMLSKGNTFPMLYNDDVNVPATMRSMDVNKKAAEQYSFFGCGEFMLSTKSIGTPNTAFNIAKALEVALHSGINPATGEMIGLEQYKMTDETTYEEFLESVKAHIEYYSDMSGKFQELCYDGCNEESSFLLISCLFDCCLERGKGILDGGIYHLGGTVETYGNVTTYDSVTAIKKVVFEEKKFSLTKLVEMLDANFVGYEKERKMLMEAPKFGNDDEYADEIAVELHEHVCHSIRNQRDKTRLDSFLVVIINNNMNVALGRYVGASADGRLDAEYLSNGNSAYTGRDKEGVTALINSMNKMDNSIHACGNQNIKLSQSMFSKHPEVTKAILKTFFAGGGQQINLSVVNQAELEDAMIHPEKHENLIVRVGGFTARFIYLDENTKRDVLSRTAY